MCGSCVISPCTYVSAKKNEQIWHSTTNMVDNLKHVFYSERLCFIGIITFEFR